VRGSSRQGRHAPAHVRRGHTAPEGMQSEGMQEQEASALVPAGAGTRRVGTGTRAAGTDPRGAITSPETLHGAPTDAAPPRRASKRGGRALLRGLVPSERTPTAGGTKLRVLVLACTPEDTTGVDLSSRSLLRLRVPWPPGHGPDLSPFDVVDAILADDPECDDLAQPEAATVSSPPRRVGSLRGRRVRTLLTRLEATHDGPLLGFHGPSAPYWDFGGLRPSLALIHPTRGPQLFRRRADASTWVRFGWERDDVWLPVEDDRAIRALDASRSERLTGRALSTALGFSPHYLLAAVSSPRSGHCYKVCRALLPRG